MTTKRRRALPNVPASTDQGTRTLLDAVKEIVETGEGVRGDPLDRKLTLRDMIESGIAELKRGATGGSGGGIGPGFGSAGPDARTPPRPQALVAAGSFDGEIILTWGIAQDAYGNHAFTNIYRSEVDNFANADLVGREVGFIYTDYVRNDAVSPADPSQLKGYFYWITFTSNSGVEGPPNSGNGTYAEPIPDIEYLLDLLGNSLADAPSTLGAEDETLILHAKRFAIRTGPDSDLFYPLIIANVGGQQTVVIDTAMIRDGSIQEGQLGPITIGKLTQPNGQPITTVSGLIRANAIDADNLRVAEAAEFYGDVFSNNFQSGVRGWAILQSGYVELNEAMIRGNLEVQTITVNGQAPFSGFGIEVGAFNYERDLSATGYTRNKIGDKTLNFADVPGGAKVSGSIDVSAQVALTKRPNYQTTNCTAGGDGADFCTTRVVQTYIYGTIWVRYRAWVNGALIEDKIQSQAGTNSSNSLTGVSININRSFSYTVPSFLSNLAVRARIEVYVGNIRLYSGYYYTYGTLNMSHNNLIMSGDVNRLGG